MRQLLQLSVSKCLLVLFLLLLGLLPFAKASEISDAVRNSANAAVKQSKLDKHIKIFLKDNLSREELMYLGHLGFVAKCLSAKMIVIEWTF